MPTKTATRRRTAIPQWFPVSILSALPQRACSGRESLESSCRRCKAAAVRIQGREGLVYTERNGGGYLERSDTAALSFNLKGKIK